MKKRIVGIIMVLIMCSTYVVMPEKAQAATLSDEMAEWFVNAFYTPGSELASAVQKTLTGQMEPDESTVKSIYSKIAKYIGYADEFNPSTGDISMLIKNTNELCKNVSAAIDIIDNYKSMLDSDLNIQKTVDALQVIKGFADLWGYGSCFPTGTGLALSTIETGIKVGGVLEQSYLQENLTIYDYELMIDYYSGNELTFRTAPTLALGTSITQEQADAMYAACYLKYYFMQQTDAIDKSGEDIGSYTFISCCTEIANATYYLEDVDIICDLIKNGLSRQGYIFMGWYTDRSYTTPIYYDENFASTNTAHKCYAKWQKRYYTITYNSNCQYVDDIVCTYDVLSEDWTAPNMIRPGYLFQGWYWDSSCTNVVTTYSKTENHTFYAKWVAQFKTQPTDGGIAITNILAFPVINGITNKDILIPNEIDGLKVKAFSSGSACTSIRIENSESISVSGWVPSYAPNKTLKQIDIINSNVNLNGFDYFQELHTINIKNSNVKLNGFDNCTTLKNVDFEQVTSIEGFYNCDALENLFFSDKLQKIDNAFAGCDNIKKVDIPEGVKLVKGSFCNCSNLTDVYISSTVVDLEGNYSDGFSFSRSNNAIITIADNNPVYKVDNGAIIDCVKKTLFLYPQKTSSTSYTVPKGIETIAPYAFRNNLRINSLIMQDGIVTIGYYAFNGCKNLSDIIIPKTVYNAELNAFQNTQWLSIQPDGPLLIGDGLVIDFRGEKTLDYIEFPREAKKINCSLQKFNKLKEIKLPEGLKYLRLECSPAFGSGCIELEKINFPKSLEYFDITGEYPFAACYKLKEVFMPNSLTIANGIHNGAMRTFEHCSSLEKVKLSDKIETVNYYMFQFCENLREISLPKNLKSIEEGAFYGCRKLQDVEVPDGTEYIGYCAFASCDSLKTLIIPDTATGFELLPSGPASLISNSKNVTIYGSANSPVLQHLKANEPISYTKQYPNGKFEHITGHSYVKVDKENGSIIGYDINLDSNIELPDSIYGNTLVEIDTAAFENCSYLKSIVVGNGLLEIKDSAFKNCTNLISVVLPESINYIAENAFEGCKNIIITCVKGSYAEQYARKMGIEYIVTDCINDIKNKTFSYSVTTLPDDYEFPPAKYVDINNLKNKNIVANIYLAVYSPNTQLDRIYIENVELSPGKNHITFDNAVLGTEHFKLLTWDENNAPLSDVIEKK